MNKKGNKYYILIGLILGIVVLIVLISGTKLWAGETKRRADVEACFTSVKYVALSKVISVTGSPWLDLKCKTNKITLSGTDKNEIMDTIAEEMYDCVYMYGSGKIDFVSNWDWGWGDNSCFVCSIISYKKSGESISSEEFIKFLKNKKYAGKSYYDYLASKGVEPPSEILIKDNAQTYIVFGITKRAVVSGFWTGCKYVFTLGSHKSGFESFLILTNNLGKCDVSLVDSDIKNEKR